MTRSLSQRFQAGRSGGLGRAMSGALCLVALGAMTQAAAAGVTITNLGSLTLEGGQPLLEVRGVTDAGVVFGKFGRPQTSSTSSFIWSAAFGLECIGCPGPMPTNEIVGVPLSGRPLLVNNYYWESEPFGYLAQHRTLDGSQPIMSAPARDMTADGSMILFDAGTWTEAGGLNPLTLPVRYDEFTGVALSEDGQRILGKLYDAEANALTFAVCDGLSNWTLLSSPVPGTELFQSTMSSDGQTVVGGFGDSSIPQMSGYRWSDARGFEVLPAPAGVGPQVAWAALACSGDGAAIVGALIDMTTGDPHACIWTESGGAALLSEFLLGMGADLTGWALLRADAISPDGRYIAGGGTFERAPGEFVSAAFIVDLQATPPASCAGDANGSGGVNFDDITEVLANWGVVCP